MMERLVRAEMEVASVDNGSSREIVFKDSATGEVLFAWWPEHLDEALSPSTVIVRIPRQP